jgi:hypothetical protein
LANAGAGQKNQFCARRYPGDAARVRHSIHSPYSGRVGVVMNIDASDERAPCLVMFSDGLQFRYKPTEIEGLNTSSHRSVFESRP